MVLEQLAVTLEISEITAVLYYLGNFPDVFPFDLQTAFAGFFFMVISSCMVR